MEGKEQRETIKMMITKVLAMGTRLHLPISDEETVAHMKQHLDGTT